jgi:hypothetical protein
VRGLLRPVAINEQPASEDVLDACRYHIEECREGEDDGCLIGGGGVLLALEIRAALKVLDLSPESFEQPLLFSLPPIPDPLIPVADGLLERIRTSGHPEPSIP